MTRATPHATPPSKPANTATEAQQMACGTETGSGGRSHSLQQYDTARHSLHFFSSKTIVAQWSHLPDTMSESTWCQGASREKKLAFLNRNMRCSKLRMCCKKPSSFLFTTDHFYLFSFLLQYHFYLLFHFTTDYFNFFFHFTTAPFLFFIFTTEPILRQNAIVDLFIKMLNL
jgi:hypothetical protein